MGDNIFKSFKMGFNYKLAEEIISCFNHESPSEPIDELTYLEDLDSESIIQDIFRENYNAVLRPAKHTLLHSFCDQYFYYYLMEERRFLLDEMCDDFDADSLIGYIKRTVNILNEYGVEVSRDYITEIETFDRKYKDSNYELYHEYKELVGKVFDEILVQFNEIEDDLIEATFYLLYENKDFLLKFNKYISGYTTKVYLPDVCFDENNYIKRVAYLPKWLKRAVFYRDKGRCQHCGKDLSGLFEISGDGELQFDHIIPLESGGTNDSTNFQLLCKKCNLKKSGQLYYPNYYYQMYW